MTIRTAIEVTKFG